MKLLTREWVEKGENAEKNEARDAIKICRAFREQARLSLDLAPE